jgi:hypothetical protein
MTNHTKELLLELLLIQVRYSDEEFRWVEEELKAYPETRVLRQLILSLQRLDVPKQPSRVKRETTAKLMQMLTPYQVQESKRKLLESLRTSGGNTSVRKISELSRRLGLTSVAQDNDEALVAIERRLNELSDRDLEELLRPSSARRAPDHGYLELASHLIHGRKD